MREIFAFSSCLSTLWSRYSTCNESRREKWTLLTELREFGGGGRDFGYRLSESEIRPSSQGNFLEAHQPIVPLHLISSVVSRSSGQRWRVSIHPDSSIVLDFQHDKNRTQDEPKHFQRRRCNESLPCSSQRKIYVSQKLLMKGFGRLHVHHALIVGPEDRDIPASKSTIRASSNCTANTIE